MYKQFLWIAPFLCFSTGYFVARSLFSQPTLLTPSIIGKQILSGALELSAHQLNTRIISQREDATLPEGTILSQSPASGHTIKSRQTVYVSVSKQPELLPAPSLVGKTKVRIEQELRQSGLPYKLFHIPSNYPKGTCIAQAPEAGELMNQPSMILYIADSATQPLIIPNFSGHYLSEIQDSLSLQNFAIETIHTSKGELPSDPQIKGQRPAPGSIISPAQDKLINIQLML